MAEFTITLPWSNTTLAGGNTYTQDGGTATEVVTVDSVDVVVIEGINGAVIDAESTRANGVLVENCDELIVRGLRCIDATGQGILIRNELATQTSYDSVKIQQVSIDGTSGTAQGDGNFVVENDRNVPCGPIDFNGCVSTGAARMGFDTQELYPLRVRWKSCYSEDNGATATGGGFFTHPFRFTRASGGSNWAAHGGGTAGTFKHNSLSALDDVSFVAILDTSTVLTEGSDEDSLNSGEWFYVVSDGLYINIDGSTDPDTVDVFFTRCPVDGFQIEDCISTLNKSSDTTHGSGIQLDDGSINSEVKRCHTFDNEGKGYMAFLCDSSAFIGCLSHDDGTDVGQDAGHRCAFRSGTATNINWIHCTGYNAPEYGLQVGNGSGTIRNSILDTSGTFGIRSVSSTITDDYNCNTDGTTGAGITTTNGITDDPSFINPAAHDFRLDGGSPCIQAAAFLTDATGLGYHGQDGLRFSHLPDMGAYAVRPGEDGATRSALVLSATTFQAGVDIAKAKAA